MGKIQSSVGLITGVPIADTVDQLIAISARPRDLLAARTGRLKSEQVAITELTALVIGVQFQARTFGSVASFQRTNASSSNATLLAATVTGKPTIGTHQYTPVRQAQSHQLLSSGFSATDQPIGAGTLSFRLGGFVDTTRELNELNGGNGVQRWKIRITDRGGSSAEVDLRFAKTVEDVLNTINSQSGINITAVASGDSIKLIDNTGQTTSNLKVVNVGTGTTATDLGLAGIDAAANEATGTDIVSLHDNLELGRLNDGNGVKFGPTSDLEITLRDASTLSIDLNANGSPKTLGEIVNLINAAAPSKLSAQISASGDTIELNDLTGGAGSFVVVSGTGSSIAEDLGLAADVTSGTITGRRLISGLQTTLISSLGGGKGLGQLGNLDITDRGGQSDTVNLSSAQTLDDVVRLINAAPNANILARINNDRSGIVLLDKSGGAGNLVVANNADGKITADKLRIAVNDSVSQIDSGSLDRQVISGNTLLASLNNGRGVQKGSFVIKDTTGKTGAVNLSVLGATTVGEVIDAINGLSIDVVAEINSTGDGLQLRDTAFGTGKIEVTDSGAGQAAADLKIAGVSAAVDVIGTTTEVIDGSTAFRISIDADDTLTDLVNAINGLDADVTAAIISDGGSSKPFRLNLTSQIAGTDGQLQFDTSGIDFSFQELSKAQDALLLVGSSNLPGAGYLVSSKTNEFANVLPGITLAVGGASADPVTIKINRSNDQLIKDIKLFVDQYNKLESKIDEVTFFSETDGSTGVLFGSSETLQIKNRLTNIIQGRYFGVGSINNLEQVGLSIDSQGKLTFDKTRFDSAYAASPDDVQALFTDENRGFNKKIGDLIDQLAGPQSSLLVNRARSLQQNIENNSLRIDVLNGRLSRQRDRMLNEFYRMEEIIGQLQSSLSAISSIQPLPSIFSTR